MKKIILLFVASLMVTSFAKASFSKDEWKYFKNILNTPDGLVEISPDNEVYAGSKKNLSDIRIVNSNNQEVPYKLQTSTPHLEITEYSVSLLNNSSTPGKNSSAILDLSKRGNLVNNINLRTTSKNFQRNVVVYGSDDKTNWNLLNSDGYIFDFTDNRENVKAQKLSIKIPDSVFQYYKIEIADPENRPIAIGGASVLQMQQEQQSLFNASVASTDINQNTNNKTTEIIVDMNQNGLPVVSLQLLSNEQNYNRGVSVYSSNDRNSQNWQYAGQGHIFNFNTPKFVGSNNTLTIGETTDRFIKLVVFNNDDAPLKIDKITVQARQKSIIFQAKDAQAYRIFYGNPNAQTPQYDIDAYFKYLDINQAKKANLGPQENNSNFVQEVKPLSERIPYLLPIALCFLGLLLLILVFRFLKKQ